MGGRGGVKKFFPHPNELLIWAYPENLVKIRQLVEAVETFPGMGWDTGTGHTSDSWVYKIKIFV